MPGHDIIVIGASAGGVDALTHLVSALPADLPAAVFVVLHIPPHGSSVLPTILNRHGALPAAHPDDGQEICSGNIYVAPPDHHLLIKAGRIQVTRGPSENGHRPAVDPLFRSAARSAGSRVIGVILSGTLDDGTAGLLAIKQMGGLAVVQDPEEAAFAGMPRSAVNSVPTDWIGPLAEIGPTLARLAREPAQAPSPVSPEIEIESEVAGMEMAAIETPRDGSPSGYTCPECHGALWEVQDGELVRFRCRVGHAYSPDSLMAEQSDALEDALWIALRALEESAALAERMSERARERGHALASDRFAEQSHGTKQSAAVIRQVLLRGQVTIPDSSVTSRGQESGLNDNPAGSSL